MPRTLITRQRHERVQTENRDATEDTGFDLVGSCQHAVAGKSGANMGLQFIFWLIKSFTDPMYIALVFS